MKVRELIEKLGVLGGETEVVVREERSGEFSVALDVVDVEGAVWGNVRTYHGPTDKFREHSHRNVDLYQDEVAARDGARSTNERRGSYRARDTRVFAVLRLGHEPFAPGAPGGEPDR